MANPIASWRIALPGNKLARCLFRRRVCWTLTLPGKLLFLVILGLGLVLFLRTAHGFLAITSPNRGSLLVVDGWSPNYTMRQAAEEFREGCYDRMLVVRAVYEGLNPYESGRYSGEYLVRLLIAHGVPQNSVSILICPAVCKDRTYHSSLALKHWLTKTGLSIDSLDVATLGPHARRSRLLCQKAMGDRIKVGIIALEDRYYDPSRWWTSSEGVQEVLGELIAYCYARFLFFPSKDVENSDYLAPMDAPLQSQRS
ncbi:MAG TPA: hypothetical protein P5186_01035 [Candidatus Paceibacterota bacterium]|nr:hypothetical protein [Candidatus Paceibacterota bacterium]